MQETDDGLMKKINRSLSMIILLIPMWVGSSYALDLDPDLHGLCDNCSMGQFPSPKVTVFNGLALAYGLALAPPMLAPANTIGINTLEVDMSYSMTSLTDDANQWVEAIRARTAPSSLMSAHFTVRKGLPYSFELEGQLGYLINSELWTMGGSLKWSFHEAVRAFPIDFTLRGSGNRMVGSSQLDLSTVGADVALGTQFGIFKLFNLAPYLGYSPVWIFSGSSTLDATPGVYDVAGNGMGTGSTALVFPRTEQMVHRMAIGLRFLAGRIKLTPEFMWTPHQFNINVGLGLHF